ncbi:hypothetical protein CLG96_08090 [Sphingomonas oleivorans]|uniref:Response regulatory domain-containing protein n=1 Tax=Sphingomonas oleivorans TaxID=1735121 RepID=A0A2T5FZ42_9SPHN|nr:response regulator [Sphingomonas oleivorans]PTQ11865.1 hypothetical protein CLG96_08090 [Sphingomonas oleivorans]
MDDDEAVREALSDLLMVSGLACRPFDGAPAFLAEYAPGRFDCLITDMRMPGMSGLELLECLHTLGSAMPAIVLTSVHDDQARTRALDLGAKAWLTKPAADDMLLRQLHAAIGGNGVIWPEGLGQ